MRPLPLPLLALARLQARRLALLPRLVLIRRLLRPLAVPLLPRQAAERSFKRRNRLETDDRSNGRSERRQTTSAPTCNGTVTACTIRLLDFVECAKRRACIFLD